MPKLDNVTEYLIAMYLAAGGSVNNVREWLKEANTHDVSEAR